MPVRPILSRGLRQTNTHATVITTHSDNAPSLRIDKPFPSLLAHAFSVDFANMDVTEHGHVPYVIILVKVLQEWKNDVSL